MAKLRETKNFVLVRWIEENNVFSVEKLKNVVVDGDSEIELGAIYDIYYKSGRDAFKGEIVLVDSSTVCNERLDLITLECVEMSKEKEDLNRKRPESKKKDQNDNNDIVESKSNKRKIESEDDELIQLQITKKKLLERDVLLSKQQKQLDEQNLKIIKLEKQLDQYKTNTVNLYKEEDKSKFVALSKSVLKLFGSDADLTELTSTITNSVPMVVLSDLFPKVLVPKQLKDEIKYCMEKKASYTCTAAFRQLFRKSINDDSIFVTTNGQELMEKYSELISSIKEYINSILSDRHVPLCESDIKKCLNNLHNEQVFIERQRVLNENSNSSPVTKVAKKSNLTPTTTTPVSRVTKVSNSTVNPLSPSTRIQSNLSPYRKSTTQLPVVKNLNKAFFNNILDSDDDNESGEN